MATYTFTPRGVCSRKIDFTLENGIIKDVRFTGGCSGNTQGVAALCIGRPAAEVIGIIKASAAVSNRLPALTSWPTLWNRRSNRKNSNFL